MKCSTISLVVCGQRLGILVMQGSFVKSRNTSTTKYLWTHRTVPAVYLHHHRPPQDYKSSSTGHRMWCVHSHTVILPSPVWRPCHTVSHIPISYSVKSWKVPKSIWMVSLENVWLQDSPANPCHRFFCFQAFIALLAFKYLWHAPTAVAFHVIPLTVAMLIFKHFYDGKSKQVEGPWNCLA